MKHSPATCFRQFVLLSALVALPFSALAQQKKEAPPPEPAKKAPAPKPQPAPKPAPAPQAKAKPEPATSRLEPSAHTNGTGNSASHSTTTHPSRPATANNNTNTGTGRNSASRTTPPPVEKDPRAPTGLNLRAEVDDGLKALSQNQGKGGIPAGPAANPRPFADGQSDPDLSVGDDLKAQQEAADQTEKDIREASSDRDASH